MLSRKKANSGKKSRAPPETPPPHYSSDEEDLVSAFEDLSLKRQIPKPPLISYSTLFNVNYLDLSLASLIELYKEFDFKLTQKDVEKIEILTRNQANNEEWYSLRTGRVTASVFKSVCRTKLDNPSMSVIKRICYPDQVAFTSKYTEWGKENEGNALEEFVALMKKKHKNFKWTNSGLMVSPMYPHFGASPDALCECDCCGKGCIEIKCPYTIKDDDSFEPLFKKVDPFLIKTGNTFTINPKHMYYYQIQMQLFITKRKYCYFVIWSPYILGYVEVLQDKPFWKTHSARANDFFRTVLFPELTGKYFIRRNVKTQAICVCNEVMARRIVVECSNDTCLTKTFHKTCLNMTQIPRDWMCEECMSFI